MNQDFQSSLVEMTAREGYNAYKMSRSGKAVNGDGIPEWDNCQEPIRQAWREAALVMTGGNMAFLLSLEVQAEKVHKTAVEHGWWEGGERNMGEMIALMHSELSEALEYYRKGNGPSDHIMFSGLEEEFADVIIRILDTAHKMNLHLGAAILAKMNFNESRPYKHGKKF